MGLYQAGHLDPRASRKVYAEVFGAYIVGRGFGCAVDLRNEAGYLDDVVQGTALRPPE